MNCLCSLFAALTLDSENKFVTQLPEINFKSCRIIIMVLWVSVDCLSFFLVGL